MVKKKKCPFRKDTYIKNTNVFNGCPMEQKVFEDFSILFYQHQAGLF